jgi:pimeloyl-ACP methyl ester carboxylesterase
MKKRKMPFRLLLIGAMLKLLGSLWPALSGYLAYRIWFTSPRFAESKRETVWGKSANKETFTVAGKQVVSYRWGAVNHGYVLLVHGWSGRATQLGAFVNAVHLLGPGVIGFDAPGHGASDGTETTILEFAESINHIVEQHGLPQAIIAHSFGCMAAALAIRLYDLKVDKLVTISCPTETPYLVKSFAGHFNLSDKVIARFNNRLTRQFGDDIFEKTSAINNLKNRSIKKLIVHDRHDKIVPWQLSEKLAEAFPEAQTIYTENLGHQRVLRDEKLIERIMEFLDG